MIHSRFPFAVFVAVLLLSQSIYARVQAAPSYDDIAGKKDNPPRPKPTPGPRDGGDDN